MFRVYMSDALLIANKFNRKTTQRLVSSANLSNSEQVNRVELIGTVQKHLFTQPSGYQAFIVQTVEPENRYYYHMIGTGSTSKFSFGQRVHIEGRISSQNYWTEQKKIRQKLIIKTGELKLLSSDDQQPDKNYVQLASQIYSNIDNKSDFSAFTLTTQHVPKGGVEAGILKSENHRILIRDPSLLDFVRNELKRLDWVRIEGKINYTFTRNSKDQLRSSGYIVATSLSKENIQPS